MTTDRCACIDIGTNSVKALVIDWIGGIAQRVEVMSEVSRLGEGMRSFENKLREAPQRRTVEALERFSERFRDLAVGRIVAVGTAALRDGTNRQEFIQRVQERCGINVEVISGEEEARLSFHAVSRDPIWNKAANLIVIDVGGGSTEIIRSAGRRISVNLGALKILEQFLRSDPPTLTEVTAAAQEIEKQMAQVPEKLGHDSKLSHQL